MGYMHIPNLYTVPEVLELLKDCYAMEKIHGTSAHIRWSPDPNQPGKGQVHLHHGGANKEQFDALFDTEKFKADIATSNLTEKPVVFFGEAYGGKMQAMSKTYGKELKFVVFDVQIGGTWLDVPNANELATKFGFDFVAWEKVPCTLEALNAERDRPSRQAKKNGIMEDMPAEGIVIRPIHELTFKTGNRVIAKHKRDEFMETAHRKEVDPAKREILLNAAAVAKEWVVPMRMTHVLDKLGNPMDIKMTGKVVMAMQEDVERESQGFVQWNDAVAKAVGKAAAIMYKQVLQNQLKQ